MDNKNTPKPPKIYKCIPCSYSSNNLKDFKRHCQTIKHEKHKNDNNGNPKNSSFVCICGKVYKYRTGLCRHQTFCKEKIKNPMGDSGLTPNDSGKNEMKYAYTCEYCGNVLSKNSNLCRHYTRCKIKHELETLKKENHDLQNLVIDTLQNQVEEKDKQIKELLPKVGSGNVTFNINNFLNEQCKDAISIEAFVEGIKISLDQLLLTKSEGVTSGISNLITENMNKLALHERPIHCSDKKREILYVKNDKWEKDTNKTDTTQMINKLCNKQLKSVNDLVDDYNDEYVDIIGKCVLNVDEKKVMKSICDSVYVKYV